MPKIQVGQISYRNPDGTFKPKSTPIYRDVEDMPDDKNIDSFARYIAALMRQANERGEAFDASKL